MQQGAEMPVSWNNESKNKRKVDFIFTERAKSDMVSNSVDEGG